MAEEIKPRPHRRAEEEEQPVQKVWLRKDAVGFLVWKRKSYAPIRASTNKRIILASLLLKSKLDHCSPQAESAFNQHD